MRWFTRKHHSSRFTVGDLVEVKSKNEILETLDAQGRLDGLPFMPEMFRYCGKRFRVYKRAHKTCDTVFTYQSRRMESAVHLDLRCDGSAHGGCEAGCLIFWKDEWLKPVDTKSSAIKHSANTATPVSRHRKTTTEADVVKAALVSDGTAAEPAYVCQATMLPYATSELHWKEFDQYVEDFRSGNVGIRTIVSGIIYKTCYRYRHAGRRIGRLIVWSYNNITRLCHGTPWPLKKGYIPDGEATPSQVLNLQPGELVRVKAYEEILRTVNRKNLNRGMTFDKEMVPYCGRTYRVLRQVNKVINEKTGEMQELKNPCIILDTVICKSRYSECRLFCPRSIYPFWREIWLERVNQGCAIEQQSPI